MEEVKDFGGPGPSGLGPPKPESRLCKVWQIGQPGNTYNSLVTSWRSRSVDVHGDRVRNIDVTRHTPKPCQGIIGIVCEAKVDATVKIAFVAIDFSYSGVFRPGFSAEKPALSSEPLLELWRLKRTIG